MATPRPTALPAATLKVLLQPGVSLAGADDELGRDGCSALSLPALEFSPSPPLAPGANRAIPAGGFEPDDQPVCGPFMILASAAFALS